MRCGIVAVIHYYATKPYSHSRPLTPQRLMFVKCLCEYSARGTLYQILVSNVKLTICQIHIKTTYWKVFVCLSFNFPNFKIRRRNVYGNCMNPKRLHAFFEKRFVSHSILLSSTHLGVRMSVFMWLQLNFDQIKMAFGFVYCCSY